MKRLTISLTLVVLLVFTGCAAAPKQQEAEDAKQPPVITEVAPKPQPAKHPPVKIGVVDLIEVSQRWTKWSRLANKLMQEERQFKNKLYQMDGDIVNLQVQLNQVPPGGAQAQQIQAQLQKMQFDMRRYRVEKEERLKELAEKLMRELLDNIHEIIKDYGKENDYTFIAQKRDWSIQGSDWKELNYMLLNNAVLYSAQGTDLTEEIIKILNEKYK